jgi:hypothetical protein
VELGNLAQWVAAVGTISAVSIALFKEPLLAWLRRPELKAEIRAEYPFCVKTPAFETSPEKWKGFRYWIRILVTNDGHSRANQVEVFLANLTKQGTKDPVGNFMPMNLQWSYIHTVYADGISPKMSRLCDLAAISDPNCPSFKEGRPAGLADNQTCLSLRLEAVPPRTEWLPPGKYQFEITIAASNCKPVAQEFSLHLTGLWSEDQKTMLTHGIVLQ